MKSIQSIEVIGDAFADVYCYLESGLPSLGGDSRLTEPIHTVAGGSALNTSTHLASLIRYFDDDENTTDINLQTVINENDVYGKLIIDHAKLHNFKLINRRVSNVPSCFIGTADAKKLAGEKSTGHCAVIVANNDRSFMTHLGCMEDFRGSHIILPTDSSADCIKQHVHIAGYYNIPGFWYGELEAQLKSMKDNSKKAGKDLTISLVPQQDATGKWDGGLNYVLKYIDFLILNEVEAKCIVGCESETDETICNRNIARHFHKSTPEVRHPVDPTGAGDAFAAGFIYGLLINSSDTLARGIKKGLEWGCSMGTCNVMVRGASTACSKQSIETMLLEIDDNLGSLGT